MIPAQDALEHQCFLDSIASHALLHPMPYCIPCLIASHAFTTNGG